VCFSPWADLAGTSESIRANDGRCAMFRPNNITDFATAYLGETSPLEAFASPVFADLAGLPPLLLQVGSTELLLDDSRRVHDTIQRAGGTSRLEIFDGVFHGWQMLAGIIPEANVALRQAAAFVRESCA
jgi:acetyl esterase/lipase